MKFYIYKVNSFKMEQTNFIEIQATNKNLHHHLKKKVNPCLNFATNLNGFFTKR